MYSFLISFLFVSYSFGQSTFVSPGELYGECINTTPLPDGVSGVCRPEFECEGAGSVVATDSVSAGRCVADHQDLKCCLQPVTAPLLRSPSYFDLDSHRPLYCKCAALRIAVEGGATCESSKPFRDSCTAQQCGDVCNDQEASDRYLDFDEPQWDAETSRESETCFHSSDEVSDSRCYRPSPHPRPCPTSQVLTDCEMNAAPVSHLIPCANPDTGGGLCMSVRNCRKVMGVDDPFAARQGDCPRSAICCPADSKHIQDAFALQLLIPLRPLPYVSLGEPSAPRVDGVDPVHPSAGIPSLAYALPQYFYRSSVDWYDWSHRVGGDDWIIRSSPARTGRLGQDIYATLLKMDIGSSIGEQVLSRLYAGLGDAGVYIIGRVHRVKSSDVVPLGSESRLPNVEYVAVPTAYYTVRQLASGKTADDCHDHETPVIRDPLVYCLSRVELDSYKLSANGKHYSLVHLTPIDNAGRRADDFHAAESFPYVVSEHADSVGKTFMVHPGFEVESPDFWEEAQLGRTLEHYGGLLKLRRLTAGLSKYGSIRRDEINSRALELLDVALNEWCQCGSTLPLCAAPVPSLPFPKLDNGMLDLPSSSFDPVQECTCIDPWASQSCDHLEVEVLAPGTKRDDTWMYGSPGPIRLRYTAKALEKVTVMITHGSDNVIYWMQKGVSLAPASSAAEVTVPLDSASASLSSQPWPKSPRYRITVVPDGSGKFRALTSSEVSHNNVVRQWTAQGPFFAVRFGACGSAYATQDGDLVYPDNFAFMPHYSGKPADFLPSGFPAGARGGVRQTIGECLPVDQCEDGQRYGSLTRSSCPSSAWSEMACCIRRYKDTEDPLMLSDAAYDVIPLRPVAGKRYLIGQIFDLQVIIGGQWGFDLELPLWGIQGYTKFDTDLEPPLHDIKYVHAEICKDTFGSEDWDSAECFNVAPAQERDVDVPRPGLGMSRLDLTWENTAAEQAESQVRAFVSLLYPFLTARSVPMVNTDGTWGMEPGATYYLRFRWGFNSDREMHSQKFVKFNVDAANCAQSAGGICVERNFCNEQGDDWSISQNDASVECPGAHESVVCCVDTSRDANDGFFNQGLDTADDPTATNNLIVPLVIAASVCAVLLVALAVMFFACVVQPRRSSNGSELSQVNRSPSHSRNRLHRSARSVQGSRSGSRRGTRQRPEPLRQ